MKFLTKSSSFAYDALEPNFVPFSLSRDRFEQQMTDSANMIAFTTSGVLLEAARL